MALTHYHQTFRNHAALVVVLALKIDGSTIPMQNNRVTPITFQFYAEENTTNTLKCSVHTAMPWRYDEFCQRNWVTVAVELWLLWEIRTAFLYWLSRFLTKSSSEMLSYQSGNLMTHKHVIVMNVTFIFISITFQTCNTNALTHVV